MTPNTNASNLTATWSEHELVHAQTHIYIEKQQKSNKSRQLEFKQFYDISNQSKQKNEKEKKN